MLISVPAILGATILEVSKLEAHALPAFGRYVAGMITAGLVGYAAIALTLHPVQQDRFYLFAGYLWPLGSLLTLEVLLVFVGGNSLSLSLGSRSRGQTTIPRSV